MSNHYDKADDLGKLQTIEKACSSKIIDARDAAISYLGACVRQMDKSNGLSEATEKIKEVENQFYQIVSRINHWRRRLEYLADMKKYGWLDNAEEAELESLIEYGADWEYYTLITSRLEPMRKRLAHLVDKQANRDPLTRYERAELGFFRSLGIESLEPEEGGVAQERVDEGHESVASTCPAGGRCGYDFDSFEHCSGCEIRATCSQKAASIEETFRDF